jgi:ABC-type transport system involved in cytochrome c biogenesis permease subunit
MKLLKSLPWIAGLLALAFVLLGALPARPVRGFDMDGFGRLPVLEGGRVKPLDSVARNALLLIRNQQSFRFEGRRIGPDEWILDVLFRPGVADAQPIFVINDPDVLGLIGVRQSSNRYFSFESLVPHIEEIEKQAQAAHPIEAQLRNRFQSAVVNLYDRMVRYHRLKNSLQLAGSPGLAQELANRTDAGFELHRQNLVQLAAFRPLPPQPGQPAEAWQSVGEALMTEALHPGLPPLAALAADYAAGNPEDFNRNLVLLRNLSASLKGDAIRHADAEMRFNRVQPFMAGIFIYLVALLVVSVSWLWKPERLQPIAFALLAAGALVHTAGLASRVILQGRPPVTNLYSSAVFVGWGVVILGLVLERMHRRGFATAVASVAGFSTLLIAHHLSMEGDTMEMMRAVLDSNFWLATHVITITIGYSGTFLAGLLALGYTLWKHLAAEPDPETAKALSSMVYGVVCFSLLFSFVGTVLGGIWADQSWGRFWGWDPKENGALLIVLWNAIILHARWGGYVRERGIMVMAIFGNIITAFSWFGVNMLGVGLHSYGFMDKAFWWLASFSLSQLLLMILCLLPRRFWDSVKAG